MHTNPDSLAVKDRYKILVGSIVPRPIAFVSTISGEGALNLAPFSFFNGVGSDPMALLFCPANNADGTEKDTLRNIGETGQFVVNVVTEDYDRRMAATAEALPHGKSEFELAGFTPAPSVVVKPPRVAESPVSFECEPIEIVRLNPGAPAGGNVVIGRVVHLHVDDDLIDERHRIDPAKLRAVGRMAGLTYCSTKDRYDIPWGRAALEE